MQQIKIQFPVEQKKYRDAGVRANAKAYESKDVIFGIVVGCIVRLDAIRATNTFCCPRRGGQRSAGTIALYLYWSKHAQD